jgi:hypothetical protein
MVAIVLTDGISRVVLATAGPAGARLPHKD